jgi:hypothetical protein
MAECQAAKGVFSLQPGNGSYTCNIRKYFGKVCVRLELNSNGGWQETTAAIGPGKGCYFQPDLTSS